MTSPFAAFGRPAPGRPNMPSQPAQPQGGMNMANVRNVYRSVFNSKNPMQAMQNMMASNPRMAQVNALLRQGRNPESIFREMAKQRGIDPDEFIREIQQGNNG